MKGFFSNLEESSTTLWSGLASVWSDLLVGMLTAG